MFSSVFIALIRPAVAMRVALVWDCRLRSGLLNSTRGAFVWKASLDREPLLLCVFLSAGVPSAEGRNLFGRSAKEEQPTDVVRWALHRRTSTLSLIHSSKRG